MTWRGRVEWVESTTPRGFLASDQTTGTTSLPIYGADSFVSSTNTGSVVIDDLTYAYTSVTVSADESVTPSTLVISPGLVQDEINGEPIELVSSDETKYAGVSTGDGIGDVMRVRVPHGLKSYSALTDGVRGPDERETVDVQRVNGELLVTNVIGISDMFDASTTPIVTSTKGGEVVRIDGDGITLSTNNVIEQLSVPLADPNATVAVDKAGFIFVSNPVGQKLHKYTAAGVEVTTGGFPISTAATAGTAFDSSGSIYALDRAANLVRKFSSAGVAGITWSTTGTPRSIGINSANQIFVYDEDNDRVRRFTTTGTETVTGNFPFAPPSTEFAIDSSDRLNFPDVSGITRYDANANAVAGVTGPILTGSGFAVGPDGAFYLKNVSLGVDKFTSAGAFVGSAAMPWGFQHIAIAPTSQILVTDPTNNLLHEYSGVDNLRPTIQMFSAEGRLVTSEAKIAGKLEVSQIVAPNGLQIGSPISAPLLDSRITPTLTNGTGTGEVLVAKWAIPAGYFTAGQMAEAKVMSQQSGTATLIWRVRMGSAGTTADALLIQFATTAAGAANAHQFANIMVQCLTAGASGTMTAGGYVSHGIDLGDGVGPLASAFSAATVDTTVARILSISVQQSASQTVTVRGASLSKMRG